MNELKLGQMMQVQPEESIRVTQPGQSYSMLSAALVCEEKYRLLYVEKVKQDGLESFAPVFGTAIHAGLTALLERGDGVTVFKLFMESVKDTPFEFGPFSFESALDLGEKFLDKFARLHLKKYEPISLEKRLYGKLGEVAVEGTPDFVGNYDGVATVVDFKTSWKPYDRNRIITNPQLYLYRELAKQSLGLEATQLVYQVFITNPIEGGRIQTLVEPWNEKRHAAHMEALAQQANLLKHQAEWSEHEFRRNPMGCTSPYVCPFIERCWGTSDSA